MFKNKKMKAPVVIDIVFEERISRLFIFRLLWVVPIIVPMAAYTLLFGLQSIVQFLHMLVLGKRSKSLFEHQMHYVRYAAGWEAYTRYFTNARPPVLPWHA